MPKCKFCKSKFETRYKPQKYCGKPCYYKSKFVVKKPCSVKGCIYKHLKAQSRGLCMNHYIIWRNHGNPLAEVRRPRGTGSITEGYKIIVVNGKRFREHRYIMESFLGRAIKPSEVVHHINGDRTDNRLSNLEVLNRGQHTSHHNFERWEIGAESFGR